MTCSTRPTSSANAGPPRWSALRIDLDIQAELEAAATARGIGVTTPMRQIIEEWMQAHRDASAPDQIGELVRHLDAARQAANNLAHRAA